MPRRQRRSAGDETPAPVGNAPQSPLTGEDVGAEPVEATAKEDEENAAMPVNEARSPNQPGQAPVEGVMVTGEAVRRVSPESAEFLMEVTNSAPTAAQALRDNHVKTTQLAQAVASMGVQPADLQTISFNIYSLYAPALHALPVYSGMPQIGHGAFPGYAAGGASAGAVQGEMQFGTYHARNTLRVNIREPARLGEIVDALTKAGAMIPGAFSFKPLEEAQARKAALEAAGRDARAKAEALAAAAGRQIGDAISICEELVATNGTYAALRASLPYSFGPGAPQYAGELEYYARVSANFRLV
jgi:uncharacterized protein